MVTVEYLKELTSGSGVCFVTDFKIIHSVSLTVLFKLSVSSGALILVFPGIVHFILAFFFLLRLLLFTYLKTELQKEMEGGKEGRKREYLSSAGSFPKWLQWPELGQPEARGLKPHLEAGTQLGRHPLPSQVHRKGLVLEPQ